MMLGISRWTGYFRKPFPTGEGFSPYRFPGLLVHLPVCGLFWAVGFLLFNGTMPLLPVLLIFFVSGIYLGRDFAVYCHYAPLFALLVVVFVLLSALFGKRIIVLFDSLASMLAPYQFIISPIAGMVLLGILLMQAKRNVTAE